MSEALLQEVLIPIALTVLTAIAAWIGTTARSWIARKARETDNQILATVYGLVGQVAATAVAETAQTAVTQLKAAREDGKLTPDEARAAFRAAVNRTWNMLGQEAKDVLTGQAGSESAAKANIVGPMVEQMVANTKTVASAPQTEVQAAKEVTMARMRLGLQ